MFVILQSHQTYLLLSCFVFSFQSQWGYDTADWKSIGFLVSLTGTNHWDEYMCGWISWNTTEKSISDFNILTNWKGFPISVINNQFRHDFSRPSSSTDQHKSPCHFPDDNFWENLSFFSLRTVNKNVVQHDYIVPHKQINNKPFGMNSRSSMPWCSRCQRERWHWDYEPRCEHGSGILLMLR